MPNSTSHVISLYDYTTTALKPWAKAGHKCYAYDILHENIWHSGEVEHFPGGGVIYKCHADLHKQQTLRDIAARHRGAAIFMSAFPVCTDLAVSGAAWFKKKSEKNPLFQMEAVGHVIECDVLAEDLGCPAYIENPVGKISTMWRKPDHIFHPFEYGGYLPEDDVNPYFPEIIPPRDAYRKKTCLWVSNGFVMPEARPVPYDNRVYNSSRRPSGTLNYSPIAGKTGGKSAKTKSIRSATPRGFADAVYLANN